MNTIEPVRIECPHCSTAYLIPQDKLFTTAGLTCRRCRKTVAPAAHRQPGTVDESDILNWLSTDRDD